MTNQSDDTAFDELDSRILAHQLAEILRDLVRAAVATGPTSGIESASRLMSSLLEGMSRMPEPPSWHTLMTDAVDALKVQPDRSGYKYEHVSLARRCTNYLIELSASDDFSAARISKARSYIDREIRHLAEGRELRSTR